MTDQGFQNESGLRWVLEAHWENLVAFFDHPSWMRDEAARAWANLDALTLEPHDTLAFIKERTADKLEASEVAAVALAVLTLGDTDSISLVMSQIESTDEEYQRGIRLGLRLAPVQLVLPQLQQFALSDSFSAFEVAYDVLQFHRVGAEIRDRAEDLLRDKVCQSTVIAAIGRTHLQNAGKLLKLIDDLTPGPLYCALQSLARLGYPQIRQLCLRRIQTARPCLTALRFLGIVGEPVDISCLIELLSSNETAEAAIEALGKLGFAESIPILIDQLENEHSANASAVALERITGHAVPRGVPPEPPAGLTELELDFWNEPGPPLHGQVGRWWSQNEQFFVTGKRYQAGKELSDNVTHPMFDQLPDDVRFDHYFRARALQFEDTPDWELETWPRYQRYPKWATS